ncbi:MAG: hypothetical protein HONBIEJF_02263 [Fimbriimonadaceae bacterium]|nr:hypothetical protein [Fimbriimonadaceae bacterium]
MRIFWTVALVLWAGAAQSLVYQQDNTGYSNIVSQEFPDYPDFSTYSSDDVQGLGHIRITGARAWGTEAGIPSENVDVVIGIGTSAYISSIYLTASGAQADTDLHFTNLDLEVSGDFRVFFWVVRPYDSGGQWFWNVTQTVTGDQLYLQTFMNLEIDPFPISDILGEPLDGSFRIEYEIVPEPCAVLALGAGLVTWACKRAGNRRPGPGVDNRG